MIAATRVGRPRAGITLTEILIAILIMGVGLISLATLFPLGLIRLREATRSARSGLLFEDAADDMDARALLTKQSFWNTWYWYPSGTTKIYRDPFTQDGTGNVAPNNSYITYNTLNTGLPICYDPLWRSLTGVAPSSGLNDPTLYAQASYFAPSGPNVADARFGSGIFAANSATHNSPYVRADPSGTPSAYGLQRLTNFIPWNGTGLTPQYNFTCHNFDPAFVGLGKQPGDVAGDVFASTDDLVFNPTGGTGNSYSSVLPDMTQGSPQSDYRFTWFFTGRQADAGVNGTQFTGEVVVCDGRPFGYDPLPGGDYAPAGETVVEGIFGVGSSSGSIVNDRAVLLRWNASLPDPQVRAGGWIADVTYEQNASVYGTRLKQSITTNTPNGTSFARCYWYQVAKRVDPQPDPTYSGYRSMTVTLTAPVRARTALDATGQPIHVNAALIMPSVISVYPRAFEVH